MSFVQNNKQETQTIPLQKEILDPLKRYENFEVTQFRINTIRSWHSIWLIFHEEIIFYYKTNRDEDAFNVKIGFKAENYERISFKFFKRDYLEGQLKTLAFPVKIKTLHKLAHFIAIKQYKTLYNNCRDSISMLLRLLNQNSPDLYKTVFDQYLLPLYSNEEFNERIIDNNEIINDRQMYFQAVVKIDENQLIFCNQNVMFRVLFNKDRPSYQLFKQMKIQKQSIDLRLTNSMFSKNDICELIDQLYLQFPSMPLRKFMNHHVSQQI